MSGIDPNTRVYAARSQVAVLYQRGNKPAKAEADKARRALTEAKLERAVQQALASAPPLTSEQRERIAQLLTVGGAK